MKTKYRFQVPGLGVVEIEADGDDDAYSELCDRLGIRMISSVEHRKPIANTGLRLVKSNKSQVTA